MISADPTPDGRPFCRVCGEGVVYDRIEDAPLLNRVRCPRHDRRDACAIEGCTRSTRSPDGFPVSTSSWLCVEHWRRFCPPRSKRRRAYRAIHREAKRRGWDADLRRRFWRFWDTMIGSARARADGGRIDVDEINRIMGWE